MEWKKELWPEWEIVQAIGAGASGTVYKIRRQDIGGTYYAALKVVSFTDNHMAIEAAREFALMEKLKGNTNIVSYEDHKIVQRKKSSGWDVLIRMELLTPLPEYLKVHAINEKEVCRIGLDICNALSLCEKKEIVHRDIKPGNIFVSEYGDYKLGDFSLAKLKTGNRMVSSPKGTYAYMAPEIYKGEAYDQTIDIYSLGLILYSLLNRGRGPFQNLPPHKVTHEEIEAANYKRLHEGNLPKPIDASYLMSTIILKACAYNPQKRYKNVSELQKALQRCMTSQGVVEKKRSMQSRLKQMSNRFGDSGEQLEDKSCTLGEANAGITLEESANVTMSDYFVTAGEL